MRIPQSVPDPAHLRHLYAGAGGPRNTAMSTQLPEWLKRRGNPDALAELVFGRSRAHGVDPPHSRPLSRLPTAALTLALHHPDQRDFGHYALPELLAAGGMGRVYRR